MMIIMLILPVSVCIQSVGILRGASAYEGAGGVAIRDEEVIMIATRTRNKIRYRRITKVMH
jgi:hypothetical protein